MRNTLNIFLIAILLMYVISSAIFKQKILPQAMPNFANRAGTIGQCKAKIEGIALALHKGSGQNKDHFLQTPLIASNLEFDLCYEGSIASAKRPNKEALQAYQITILKAVSELPIHGTQQNILQFLGLVSFEYEPIGPFARLRDLIDQYRYLNSGQGLWHYITCDYSVLREPSYTYHLARHHYQKMLDSERGTQGTLFSRKLSECGLEFEIEDAIQKRLSDSLHLPVQFN